MEKNFVIVVNNFYKMKKTSIIIFLFCLQKILLSQELQITGYITNSNLNPVEVATVSLCKKDSTVLSFSTTSSEGYFFLSIERNKVINRNLLLNITHISYNTQTIPIKISSDTVINILLQDNVHNLNEVVITAKKKPVIEFRDGNLVVNTSQIPNAETYDMAKLLSRLPGVSASDKEGLTYNGMPATLYIDGRKQTFSISSAINLLKTIPASAIEQVELNSMSLAQYDASSGAVINIKTKKQRIDGYYTSIGGESRTYDDKNIDVGTSMSYMFKKNRVMFNATFSYKNDYTKINYSDSTLYAGGSSILIDQLHKGRTNIYTGFANLNWDVKNGHTFNFNFFFYDDFGKHNTSEPTLIHDITDNKYIQSSKSKTNDDLWSANIEYQSRDSLSSRLKASYGIVYGGIRAEKEYYNQADNITEKKWYLDSDARMIGHRHTGKIDFEQKIGNNLHIDIGVKVDFGKLNDDVTYVTNTQYTVNYPESHFTGMENVFASYVRGIYTINDKWSIKGAIRAENTNYDINLRSENISTSRSYWNIFPYLTSTFKTNNYKTSFGFASAISRPNYEWLLPGIRYSNEYSYTVGNPNLEPSKIYTVAWNQLFFEYVLLNMRYSYFKDISGSIIISHNDNVTEYGYKNFADMQKFDATLSLPFQFFDKKFSGKIEGSVAYSKYRIAKNGFQIPIDRNGFWKGSIGGIMQYQITDRFGINTWFKYYPSHKMLQYDLKSRGGMDLGISYSVLKNDRLIFTLDAENIFDSFDKAYTYYYDGNIKTTNRKVNLRFIKFSFLLKLRGGEKISDKAKNNLNDIKRFSGSDN